MSGTRGALARGAPLVASADAPATLYVPDADSLGDVVNRWGEAPRGTFGFGGLTVAVDLAVDRARGREILDDWTPKGIPRVW